MEKKKVHIKQEEVVIHVDGVSKPTAVQWGKPSGIRSVWNWKVGID